MVAGGRFEEQPRSERATEAAADTAEAESALFLGSFAW
jgi:hypothetical protein